MDREPGSTIPLDKNGKLILSNCKQTRFQAFSDLTFISRRMHFTSNQTLPNRHRAFQRKADFTHIRFTSRYLHRIQC